MQQHQQQYRVAGISFKTGRGRMVIRPSLGYVFWQLLPAAIGAWVTGWLLAQDFSSPAGSAETEGGGRAPSAALFPVALVVLGAVGASAHTLRLLRRPYVFDRGTGVFRRESNPICPLTAIRGLEIEPTAPSADPAALARPYYRLNLCYATGSVYLATRAPHLGRVFLFEFDSPGRACEVARELAHFVGVPVLALGPGPAAAPATTAPVRTAHARRGE